MAAPRPIQHLIVNVRRGFMENQQLIKNLIPLWYAMRRWAEDILCRTLGLESSIEVLAPENRGKKAICGTNWVYCTHGLGVNIYKTEDVGGIDFDFNEPDPDPWRLKIFFKRQYNDGILSYELYRELFEDEELLSREVDIYFRS